MKILTHPNPLLRQKAKVITDFDEKIKDFADKLTKMMLTHDGVGLAAPQVGESIRLIAVNIEKKKDYPDWLTMPMVLINPYLLQISTDQVEMDEACLSLPGLYGCVWRPEEVIVTAQDIHGQTLHIETGGWFARVLQHEIDHLNGILFVDRINDKKQIKKYDPKKLKLENKKSKN